VTKENSFRTAASVLFFLVSFLGLAQPTPHYDKYSFLGARRKSTDSFTFRNYRTNFTKKICGTPKDNCWIFLVKKGKISTYSISSDIESDPMINFIQKSEGEIVPIDPATLEDMVSDNEKALMLVRKGYFLKAIEKYNSH
jgi:hypothetical protein